MLFKMWPHQRPIKIYLNRLWLYSPIVLWVCLCVCDMLVSLCEYACVCVDNWGHQIKFGFLNLCLQQPWQLAITWAAAGSASCDACAIVGIMWNRAVGQWVDKLLSVDITRTGWKSWRILDNVVVLTVLWHRSFEQYTLTVSSRLGSCANRVLKGGGYQMAVD